MKIVYFIQTHRHPEQIYRLVSTIKRSSPSSQILISHNYAGGCPLDPDPLTAWDGVYVIKKQAKGDRGDFALSQAYLDGIDWLFSNQIDFDWLINLTGQDYPIKPIPEFEDLLTQAQKEGTSGFMEHQNLFSKDSYFGIRESQTRYLYQYKELSWKLTSWQYVVLKSLRRIINNVQPWFRIYTSYGLKLGVRASNSPFNSTFQCYGGSYFKILSRECVEYLSLYARQNLEFIRYYQHTVEADESWIQTALVNSGRFKFEEDDKFYIDWAGTRHGRPRVLNTQDLPALIQSEAFFARKFDLDEDKEIFDLLDKRILLNQNTQVVG